MSNSSDIGITVRLAKREKDIAEASHFVDCAYVERYGIQIPLPEHLLIALRNESIIGTFGITAASAGSSLRLPARYRFEQCSSALSPCSSNSVEFVRWISGSRKVSALLIEAGACYALKLGKKYAWCEQTRVVHRASRIYGIQFNHVSSVLDDSSIEPGYAAYYQKEQPSLYFCELTQVRDAALSFLDSLP